jgi:outer membrane receptor for ferrienterochelin and colicins
MKMYLLLPLFAFFLCDNALALIYGGNPVLEGRRVGSAFNYGPLGGFVNLDLGLGWHFGRHVTLSGQVVNLFNSEVREFVASPSVSRLFSLELRVELGRLGM